MSTTFKARSDPSRSAPAAARLRRVLVTGGTGFLGSAVVRALVSRGTAPVVFRRSTSDVAKIAGVEREEIIGDLVDLRPLAAILPGCDAVIHCAAVADLGHASVEQVERINVQATARLAALCRQTGVGRFVCVSSAGTMGPVTGGVADETAPFTMGHNPYFASKYRAEQAVLAEVHQGLDAVIVNPAAMLGANGLSPNQQRLLRQATRSGICVVPPGGQSFVAVEDVANGILKAAERGLAGERYLLGGENLTFAEYTRRVAAVVGRRPRIVRPPAALFRAASAAGQLLGSLMPATLRDPTAVAWLCRNAFYSSRKAIGQLGYRITPLAGALPAIVARYG